MQHHPWPISECTEGEELRNTGYNSIPEIENYKYYILTHVECLAKINNNKPFYSLLSNIN